MRLRTLGWTVFFLAALAGIARLFFVDVWKLPEDSSNIGISVEPTLSEGDLVLMLTRGEPGFGDLVRCTDPEDAAAFVVGRIAGVPGDTVVAHGRGLTVNGKRYESENVCAEGSSTVVHPVSGEKVNLVCDQVEMGGRVHKRGSSEKRELASPTQVTVAPGKVFLLSDDRSFPYDSRRFGTVPIDSCKNRIFFRFWGKAGWSDDKRRLSYIR